MGINRHPSPRTNDQAVYVPALRSLLIYGGLAQDQFTVLDDTWAFRDRQVEMSLE